MLRSSRAELFAASALGKVGRSADGLQLVENALRRNGETGEKEHEAEFHRLLGELLLTEKGNNDEADRAFRTAIDVARRQRVKSWELRATTSLERLLAKQGKRDEARAMLADICNWFTEGFDTADFKDAEALLDQECRYATSPKSLRTLSQATDEHIQDPTQPRQGG